MIVIQHFEGYDIVQVEHYEIERGSVKREEDFENILSSYENKEIELLSFSVEKVNNFLVYKRKYKIKTKEIIPVTQIEKTSNKDVFLKAIVALFQIIAAFLGIVLIYLLLDSGVVPIIQIILYGLLVLLGGIFGVDTILDLIRLGQDDDNDEIV